MAIMLNTGGKAIISEFRLLNMKKNNESKIINVFYVYQDRHVRMMSKLNVI